MPFPYIDKVFTYELFMGNTYYITGFVIGRNDGALIALHQHHSFFKGS